MDALRPIAKRSHRDTPFCFVRPAACSSKQLCSKYPLCYADYTRFASFSSWLQTVTRSRETLNAEIAELSRISSTSSAFFRFKERKNFRFATRRKIYVSVWETRIQMRARERNKKVCPLDVFMLRQWALSNSRIGWKVVSMDCRSNGRFQSIRCNPSVITDYLYQGQCSLILGSRKLS